MSDERAPDLARQVLLDQLAISWALLDHHLQDLVDADLAWAPADLHWTMREVEDGWQPDWSDVEPEVIPVPTVSWLTWHLGWWWTTALAHLRGEPLPDREDVRWPGSAAATVEWLGRIHDDYLTCLRSHQDLTAESAFPWPSGSGRSLLDLAAWVNVELMKNAAEAGQLLLIRRARQEE